MCERSLSGSGAGPQAAASAQFVRGEMLPSGYLVRPCDGGGSIIHIVDHLNLQVRFPKDLLVHFSCLQIIFSLTCLFRLGLYQRCYVRFMNRQKSWRRG